MSENGQTQAADAAEARREALAERIFAGVLGLMDVHMIHVGDRLGLYAALTEGPLSPAELASRTNTNERYVREWLEQQAVSGLLEVAEDSDDARARRFALPDAHAPVLADRDHPAYMAAFARMMVGMVRPLPAVIEAFRSGDGVPYADYDPDFCEGQADMNRVMFVHELASEWLPKLPDVHERLSAGGGRVADVACGAGYSSIAMAEAYPGVTVDGYDLDPYSIELAQRHAEEAGLAGRVRFEIRDAAEAAAAGERYDLVTIFEAVHDLSHPVAVLEAARGLLADGAPVLIADENVAESFTAPGDEVERVMYAFSVLHCLPTSMVAADSAATGTAMRPSTLEGYARDAGFGGCEILPIENDFWRFYRLDA